MNKTYRLVTFVAALIIIVDKATPLVAWLVGSLIERMAKTSRSSLEDVFDLWWVDGPLEALRHKVAELSLSNPGETIEHLREFAFLIALTARYGHSPEVESIPVLGKVFRKMSAYVDDDLNDARAVLLDYEIDPREIERHFAP